MNIHEYQAKQLLAKYGIPIPAGDIAYRTHEAEAVAKWLDEKKMVIKAQIHAGGRGKAGGVKVVGSIKEATETADKMLGMTLITKQTRPEGQRVRRVYIESACEISKELYLCILNDRETSGITIISSTEGGMDIEEVAEKTPKKIFKTRLMPGLKLRSHHARKISYDLGLSGKTGRKAQQVISNTYKAFVDLDAQMIEINPLVVTKSGDIVVIDCKMTFDENSLYRQRIVEELRDDDEMDALELEASRHDLNYVKLDGNIGLMVNGAGLSMATMDIIKHYGGKSANFMDVTGAASPDRVAAAFKLIYSDQDIKGILVNIFGGMMRCDDIAKGLIAASKEVGLNKPLVVRLEGTNIDAAKEILKQSKLPIQPVSSMDDAAKKIVESVKDIE